MVGLICSIPVSYSDIDKFQVEIDKLVDAIDSSLDKWDYDGLEKDFIEIFSKGR